MQNYCGFHGKKKTINFFFFSDQVPFHSDDSCAEALTPL